MRLQNSLQRLTSAAEAPQMTGTRSNHLEKFTCVEAKSRWSRKKNHRRDCKHNLQELTLQVSSLKSWLCSPKSSLKFLVLKSSLCRLKLDAISNFCFVCILDLHKEYMGQMGESCFNVHFITILNLWKTSNHSESKGQRKI